MTEQTPQKEARNCFLQIRLDTSERDFLRQAAQADHLDLSTWARRGLLGLAGAGCIQISLGEEDRALLQRAAKADFLDVATWARRELLRAATAWDAKQKPGGDA